MPALSFDSGCLLAEMGREFVKSKQELRLSAAWKSPHPIECHSRKVFPDVSSPPGAKSLLIKWFGTLRAIHVP